MDREFDQMSGTWGWKQYDVIAASSLGRVGYRLGTWQAFGGGKAYMRVVPRNDTSLKHISNHLSRSQGWKRADRDGGSRIKKEVPIIALGQSLFAALNAIDPAQHDSDTVGGDIRINNEIDGIKRLLGYWLKTCRPVGDVKTSNLIYESKRRIELEQFLADYFCGFEMQMMADKFDSLRGGGIRLRQNVNWNIARDPMAANIVEYLDKNGKLKERWFFTLLVCLRESFHEEILSIAEQYLDTSEYGWLSRQSYASLQAAIEKG